MENYPGFPGGISGPELVKLFQKQIGEYQIRVKYSEVVSVISKEDTYILKDSEKEFHYDYVVVASGTKPKIDDISAKLVDKDHVHHDIRKLLELKDKTIAIIGSGDAAFDQAINLSRSNDILIINRDNELKCLSLLSEKALQIPRIKYLGESNIQKIKTIYNPEGIFDHIDLELSNKNKVFLLECDEIVFAIGRTPQIDFIDTGINEERLFYIGDVHNGKFRQTSIAVGEGVMAAMKINDSIVVRS